MNKFLSILLATFLLTTIIILFFLLVSQPKKIKVDNETRIKYYLGSLIDSNYHKTLTFKSKNKNLESGHNCYDDDLNKILEKCKPQSDKTLSIPFACGDVNMNMETPTYTKTRPIFNGKKISNNVLLPLETHRHLDFAEEIYFRKVFEKDWYLKSEKLVWRGADTGNPKEPLSHSRFRFVELYFNKKWCDIAFSEILQGNTSYKSMMRSKINKSDLLNHKYLISIEGNDVASNLKWMLTSNSVVLMPRPTMESWYMEGLLIPYIHYVPINHTFDDLEEKWYWCQNNQDKCIEISNNATMFMEQFFDSHNELDIACEVMKRVDEIYQRRI